MKENFNLEQDYPWFRFYPEALTDPKIVLIANNLGFSIAEILGAWVSLLCLTARSPVKGGLFLTAKIPLSVEDISTYTRIEVERLSSIIALFAKYEMLKTAGGAYYLVNWHKRQYKSDHSTSRVRDFRAKKREEEKQTGDETKGNVAETLQGDQGEEGQDDPPLLPGQTRFNPDALSDETRAQRVFQKVTGFVTFPNVENLNQYIEILIALFNREERSEEALIAYLAPFWDKWNKSKTKDGRPYNRTNLRWLDWAVAGQIPQGNTDQAAPTSTPMRSAIQKIRGESNNG